MGWDGRIFDCDFNQQLELGMGTAGTNARASEKLRAVKVGAVGSVLNHPVLCGLHATSQRLLDTPPRGILIEC